MHRDVITWWLIKILNYNIHEIIHYLECPSPPHCPLCFLCHLSGTTALLLPHPHRQRQLSTQLHTTQWTNTCQLNHQNRLLQQIQHQLLLSPKLLGLHLQFRQPLHRFMYSYLQKRIPAIRSNHGRNVPLYHHILLPSTISNLYPYTVYNIKSLCLKNIIIDCFCVWSIIKFIRLWNCFHPLRCVLSH